jgi:hypothetical protein
MMIAYLVHDLGDPAVRRRVRTLQRAGAEVALAGFRRKDALAQRHDVAAMVELGQTFDHKFMQRAVKALSMAFRSHTIARGLPPPDVILARNLEMLFIAKLMQLLHWPRARLSYEVLDVHRMMLRRDPLGAVLRLLERTLAHGAQAIIISSIAFKEQYFTRIQKLSANYYVAENKIVSEVTATAGEGPPPGPPWRLAWYGMLRCQKSLDILDQTSRALGGLLEVDVRGRPTLGFFRNFDAQVAQNPHIRYAGPYAAAEIWSLYEKAHFVWGVDYTDEGANSDWLLPNRLYEGGAADVPVIALAQVETGRWLQRLGLGVLLEDMETGLERFVRSLDHATWLRLREEARRAPRSALIWSDEEGARLLEALHG